MYKKIIFSVFTLSLVATVGIIYAKKKPAYVYQFPLTIESPEKIEEDFQKQVSFYLKRLKRNPSSFQDTAIISQLYAAQGKNSGLINYFQLAQNYAFKSIYYTHYFNTTAYFVLADIAQTEHQFPKSILYAQKILKEKPRSPEAFLILVKAYLALGNLVEANHYADELISVMPSESAYTFRAIVLSNQGRDDEAILDFEEALKIEEDDPVQASFTRVMYARFYITNYNSKKGSLNFAEDLLKEALRITPTSHLALGLTGDFFEKDNNNYKAAIKFYKAAFSESKLLIYLLKEARAHKLLGEEAFAQALYKQTEILLRDDLRKNKNANNNELIRLLLERGNSKDYPEAMRLAFNERKIRGNPETLILLSWALEMNNHLVEARRVLRDVLAKNYRSDEIYIRAISIEDKLKNSNLAKLYRNNLLTSSI
jgi:tetratricopeptide (TPR) repeat protein